MSSKSTHTGKCPFEIKGHIYIPDINNSGNGVPVYVSFEVRAEDSPEAMEKALEYLGNVSPHHRIYSVVELVDEEFSQEDEGTEET